LEALAADIRAQCGVQVLVITADASDGEKAVDFIAKEVKGGLQGGLLTMLVNNVGVEFGEPCPLVEKKAEEIKGMVDVNVFFSTLMTAKCLPLLFSAVAPEDAQRGKRAAVINVASTAVNATPPLTAVYSGTKAYNTAFSTSLSSEMRRHHPSLPVDVLSARASFVETRMSGLKANTMEGMMLQVILPASFASSCLDKLSYVDDISPHWAHDFQTIIVSSLPRFLSERFLYSRVSARYAANKLADGKKLK